MTAMAVKPLDRNFTLDRLERLLRVRDQQIHWRHDVDFDPEAAVKMAQLEHRLGVQSTYYIMARGDNYNPFGPKTSQLFKTIVGYGHTLGMHVDLQLGRGSLVSTETMRQACLRDWLMFEESNLEMSRRVAFHAPPRHVYWRDIPGFTHALAPEWEDRYIGDSRGVWRESPEEKIMQDGPVQVNCHPEWWFWPAGIAEHTHKLEMEKP